LKAEEEDNENDYKYEGDDDKQKIDEIEMKEIEKLIKNNHANYQ